MKLKSFVSAFYVLMELLDTMIIGNEQLHGDGKGSLFVAGHSKIPLC